MEKVLNVKDSTNAELMSLFGRWGLGNLLRHLSLGKPDGLNAVTLILVLCMSRFKGKSIFGSYRNHFYPKVCGAYGFYKTFGLKVYVPAYIPVSSSYPD